MTDGIRAGFRNPLVTGAAIPPGTITTAMLDDGAVTSQKIASNLQSDNYDGGVIGTNPGTVGWRIERNTGDAVFSNVIVRGEIESSTVVGSTITGSLFRTAASGERIEIDGSTGASFIELYNTSGDLVGFMGWGPTGYGASDLVISTEEDLNPIVLAADGAIELTASGSAGFGVHVTNAAPAGAIPGNPFIVESGTGDGFRVINRAGTSGAQWAFDSDTDTGFARIASNEVGIWNGGTLRVEINNTSPFVTLNPANADGNIALLINIERSWKITQRGTGASTGMGIESTTNKQLFIGSDSNGDMAMFTSVTSGSTFFIDRWYTDVGNVEVLRADRTTSKGLEPVGYFSSWARDPKTGRKRKHRIVKLGDRSKWWRREWFMDLEPIKFERVRNQGPENPTNFGKGRRPIEFGFSIENLIQHTNLLTTKGDQVGESPDENALIAVTVDFVQAQERRIEQLESRLNALERRLAA